MDGKTVTLQFIPRASQLPHSSDFVLGALTLGQTNIAVSEWTPPQLPTFHSTDTQTQEQWIFWFWHEKIQITKKEFICHKIWKIINDEKWGSDGARRSPKYYITAWINIKKEPLLTIQNISKKYPDFLQGRNNSPKNICPLLSRVRTGLLNIGLRESLPDIK